ncbi:MAG TPA: winged helix-turn-helix transcriptional regulator [Solirubrobacterales bacterium]|nr:winged helix-turn-helix transcriptional regulator [Solirubrobacterales bacterium]
MTGGRADQLTTGNVLRLLGAGASGAILMTLGERPLRTKELTRRITGYAPRTVYRYATRLTEAGVIDRDEEPGVPSKVTHSLAEPGGRDLFELVDAYANASLRRLPSGEIAAPEWGSLGWVADLWESRMLEELNHEPKTLTELARGEHGLSFHQVSRRVALLARGGFIEEIPADGGRKRYALTGKARRAGGLIAGIGRWRRRHVVTEGSGLSVDEAAGVMRVVLPLIVLPDHVGKSFELRIASAGEKEAGEEPVWGDVGGDGAVVNCRSPLESTDSSARGNVAAWVDSLLDGPRNGLKTKGDSALIGDCLRQLHEALWSNGAGSAPAAAEAVAGGRDGA